MQTFFIFIFIFSFVRASKNFQNIDDDPAFSEIIESLANDTLIPTYFGDLSTQYVPPLFPLFLNLSNTEPRISSKDTDLHLVLMVLKSNHNIMSRVYHFNLLIGIPIDRQLKNTFSEYISMGYSVLLIRYASSIVPLTLSSSLWVYNYDGHHNYVNCTPYTNSTTIFIPLK